MGWARQKLRENSTRVRCKIKPGQMKEMGDVQNVRMNGFVSEQKQFLLKVDQNICGVFQECSSEISTKNCEF